MELLQLIKRKETEYDKQTRNNAANNRTSFWNISTKIQDKFCQILEQLGEAVKNFVQTAFPDGDSELLKQIERARELQEQHKKIIAKAIKWLESSENIYVRIN